MNVRCLDTNKLIGSVTLNACIPDKASQRWTFYHKVIKFFKNLLNFNNNSFFFQIGVFHNPEINACLSVEEISIHQISLITIKCNYKDRLQKWERTNNLFAVDTQMKAIPQ